MLFLLRFYNLKNEHNTGVSTGSTEGFIFEGQNQFVCYKWFFHFLSEKDENIFEIHSFVVYTLKFKKM